MLLQFQPNWRFRDLSDAFDALVFPEAIPPQAQLPSLGDISSK